MENNNSLEAFLTVKNEKAEKMKLIGLNVLGGTVHFRSLFRAGS